MGNDSSRLLEKRIAEQRQHRLQIEASTQPGWLQDPNAIWPDARSTPACETHIVSGHVSDCNLGKFDEDDFSEDWGKPNTLAPVWLQGKKSRKIFCLALIGDITKEEDGYHYKIVEYIKWGVQKAEKFIKHYDVGNPWFIHSCEEDFELHHGCGLLNLYTTDWLANMRAIYGSQLSTYKKK